MTATNTLGLIHDAYEMADLRLSQQRYSKARDSFVWLSLEESRYVMWDQRTGSAHSLEVAYTNRERLASHWAGFCAIHDAS